MSLRYLFAVFTLSDIFYVTKLSRRHEKIVVARKVERDVAQMFSQITS